IVPVYYPLHDGQTNTCAFEFLRGMEALKNTEEFRGVLHLKANPVVPYKINRFTFARNASHLDESRLVGTRIFDRVGNQIDHYLPQQGLIPFCWQHSRKLKLHLAARILSSQLFEGASRERFQVDGRRAKRLPANTREGKQILDQLVHTLGVAP